MFSKKEYIVFIAAIAVISIAYLLMAIDPKPNGFGVLTLWFAPPILLVGFALPVIGIVGFNTVRKWRVQIKTARHLAGLAVALIALIMYALTLEPTASLWDCSEFIAAAYKLQVPHTPGTPLSLLVGRIFTMFASQPTDVALMVNFSSAFFSALCTFLVYHIIYFLPRGYSTLTNRSKLSPRKHLSSVLSPSQPISTVSINVVTMTSHEHLHGQQPSPMPRDPFFPPF